MESTKLMRSFVAIVFSLLLVCLIATGQETPASKGTRELPHFTVSTQTTFLLEPKNPDRTINYVAGLNARLGEGVTADNNAAVLILRALGPSCIDAKYRAKLLAAMDLADLPEQGDYFTDCPRELYDAEARGSTQPAVAAANQQLVDWLKASQAPLDLAVEAGKRPRFFIPFVSSEDPPSLMEGFMAFSQTRLRAISKALAARAAVRLDQGDVAGALSDKLTQHRLARLVAHRPLLIDYLVALAMESLANRTNMGLIASHRLSGADARKYLADVQALEPLPSVADVLDSGERFFGLDYTSLIVRKGLNSVLQQFDPARLLGSSEKSVEVPDVDLDIDQLLRLQNAQTDELVAAARLKTYAQRRDAFARLANQPRMKEVQDVLGKGDKAMAFPGPEQYRSLIKKVGTRDRSRLTKAIFELMESSSAINGRASMLADRGRMDGLLTQVALALEIHHAEQGHYPSTLGDLAPKYIKQLPDDIFSGEGLKYQLKGEGFVLYSVGPNLKDDDGKGSAAAKDDEPDDVAVEVP